MEIILYVSLGLSFVLKQNTFKEVWGFASVLSGNVGIAYQN